MDEQSIPGTPESQPERISDALTRAERELTSRLATVLALEGCTIEEWRALTLLADGAGHPMSELAKCVFLPSPTVTRLVDRMVADNLVYRKIDPRDRRRVLVFTTVRGRRLTRKLDRLVRQCEEHVLAHAGAADAARLVELLAVIESPPSIRLDQRPRTRT